jgi:hypothetical protein
LGVGEEGEALQVGVEGTESVDLPAVAGRRGWASVPDLEAVLPTGEVAVDLLGAHGRRGALTEPGQVAGEDAPVTEPGSLRSRLPFQVGIESSPFPAARLIRSPALFTCFREYGKVCPLMNTGARLRHILSSAH